MFHEGYEEFTEEQKKILERYTTNTSGSIFALKNLPEVIKGALFSRYSRSNLGLRSLLLKEFVSDDEEAKFHSIAGSLGDEEALHEQTEALKKAQNFYDRILDGYGDDSIGELGGAHLALENISMLAAKVIQDCRLGGSPLEKSTRYIYFDQKVSGDYLFFREPVIMTSAFRDLYVNTANHLFETYRSLIEPLTKKMELTFPKDPTISKTAYGAALRAKVLDCLRGLLPASTLTNMGVFGNGRFYEGVLHKLHAHHLGEMNRIGKCAFEELSKVIPSFVRRGGIDHRTHQSYTEWSETLEEELKHFIRQKPEFPDEKTDAAVKLIDYDPESVYDVAAALLFPQTEDSLTSLRAYCKNLPREELAKLLDLASSARETRRHKSPRALEMAHFTFEIVTDFGAYRDLHRHRVLSQEKQRLGTSLGYYIPPELLETSMEEPYRKAMDIAIDAYLKIAQELPEEAQYIVPMAFNIRWYFHINLRSLQWMTELRSQAQGHPSYRLIAQQMVKLVSKAIPQFERFFKFVDFDGYDLGRVNQEMRNEKKKQKCPT